MSDRKIILLSLFFAFFPAFTFSDGSEPELLVELNTNYTDKAPFLSSDGLTLYFARASGPGWSYARLYQATRLKAHDSFNSIEEITALNSSTDQISRPWVSPDNLRLYY